jgi:hypothetical protein
MNRMRLWRAKKMFGETGRLIQICVWAPERSAELVRELCTLVAAPGERGENLRSALFHELKRRRTLCRQWAGIWWKAEVDYPFVGPWWFMRHIGGRILGPNDAHIELSPEEAEDLKKHLQDACDREIKAWAQQRKFRPGLVRDDTGVLLAPGYEEDRNTAQRPADDAAFAAHEARIARTVLDAAVASRKPPVKDPSVIEYESYSNFPSFCQIAHRRHATPAGERVQFALIHMPHGGVSPTNMIESLATHLRQQFYPKVDPGKIDWFDVVPPNTYSSFDKLTINSVSLEHANGVYSHPSWSPANDNIPEDFAAFILDTIARGQKSRALAESALHDAPGH